MQTLYFSLRTDREIDVECERNEIGAFCEKRGFLFSSLVLQNEERFLGDMQSLLNFIHLKSPLHQKLINEGLARARTKGKRFGRPPTVSQELAMQVAGLKELGFSYRQISKKINVSRQTVVRSLEKFSGKEPEKKQVKKGASQLCEPKFSKEVIEALKEEMGELNEMNDLIRARKALSRVLKFLNSRNLSQSQSAD
jgi:hypothetical protein